MVELALDANEHVDVHERTRSARAEERYRASVARRQDAFAHALGSRFGRGERGFINRIDGLPFVSVFVTPGELRSLAVIPYVASIAEEGQAEEFLQDTVPQVEADTLQASGQSGIYRTVAVIDSGVQTNHPFFSARLVGGACYSTSDPPHGPICAGGAASGSTTVASGGPCSHSETAGSVAGDCRHGTHVAGIAVGSASPRKGVAPSANLISIQVSSQTSTGCAPGLSVPCRRILESDVVNALNRVYAIRNNYSISGVNLSLGITTGGFSSNDCSSSWPALTTAIGQLEAAHIPVVAASGNSAQAVPTTANKLPAPACITKTISVAAVNKNDAFASYANANQGLLDMLAPGGDDDGTGEVESSVVGSTYGSTSGTSQAAPHVAGALAALKNLFPYASSRAIQAQLVATGDGVSVLQSGSSYVKPRLDTYAAATSTPTAPASAPAGVTVTRASCYGTNDVSWSAVSGANEYHVEGSTSSSFTSPSLFGLTQDAFTGTSIDVPSTRYIRVRACNGVSCGPWGNANITATYYPGCL